MSAIDTGDTVAHMPSGETWVVAYVQGDRLSWCGWPDGFASLHDCELQEKATPEDRLATLKMMANSSNNGHRQRYARKVLAEEGEG